MFTYASPGSQDVLESRQNVITISDGGKYSQVKLTACRWCWRKPSEIPLIPSVSPKPSGSPKGSKMFCQTHQSLGRAAPSLKSFRTPKCPKTSVPDISIAFLPADSKGIPALPRVPDLMRPDDYSHLLGGEEWALWGGNLWQAGEQRPSTKKWVGRIKVLSWKAEWRWSQLRLGEAGIKTEEDN